LRRRMLLTSVSGVIDCMSPIGVLPLAARRSCYAICLESAAGD
jgi:hypothetical protein